MDSGDCLTGIVAIVAVACLGAFVIGALAIVIVACISLGGVYGGCVGAGRSIYTYFSAFNKKCH
jgi:hypothetical protein